MLEKLRFAVVGCGSLARSQHLPHLVRSEKAEIEICVDTDPRAREACRQEFGVGRTSDDFESAIADDRVDAVCLAATEKLRLPVIRAAAAARKPIYVEKPLATTLDEVYEIQRIVKASGIAFCIGHNRRSSPAMIYARALFRQHMERAGRNPWRYERDGKNRPQLPDDGVPAASVRINDDWYSWKGWVFDKTQAPFGPILFEMTHFTDLCTWFLASRPTEVVAFETGMLNHGVLIKYESGAIASILMGANGSLGYPKELYEFMGNGGVVAIDHMVEVRTAGLAETEGRKVFPLINDPYPLVGAQGGIIGWSEKRARACADAQAQGVQLTSLPAEPDKGHSHSLSRFIDQIRGVGPEVCGIDDAVSATRVAFAAIKSVQLRRPVALTEL